MERKDNPEVLGFGMTQEWTSRLLRPRLVREDVFIQALTQDEVGMIRKALERGLTPTSFKVVDNTLILRFDLDESQKPLQEE